MNVVFCHECGKKINRLHKFCYACGTKLDTPQKEPLKDPSEPPPVDFGDLFSKVEETLRRESNLSYEEFEKNWGQFKDFHLKNYEDNDIYWIFVKVAFYSGMRAGTVTSKLPRIKQFLGDYLIVKDYGTQDIQRIMADPGTIHHERKIKGCINNAIRFDKLVGQYGSFRKYIESFGDLTKDSVLERLKVALKDFEFIGRTTAFHVMLDLGLNVWKPDRVMCRILERLGLLSDRNDIEQAVQIGKKFARNIDFPIRYIDIVMVKYGQQGPEEGFGLKDGICLEKNPRCSVCGITEYCKWKPG